ncbi:MAG: class I SAM-dependent RNA methyltransferase, partial [Desulfovibrio sp.]|nr:class I SAM-dependent RNA methyltransferase [Desulfovibrio sp.]
GIPLPPDTRPPRADVLVDPPRAGLAPRVLSALQALAPERILYISCNPSTLARDARSLQQTHILTNLAAVDLFPHTPHLECLSLWRRR